ncbi:MAG: hypothetical protein SPK03_01875 [Alloprevotella sp.]|nr:hypothetical protein [Alloprevotella sp.]
MAAKVRFGKGKENRFCAENTLYWIKSLLFYPVQHLKWIKTGIFGTGGGREPQVAGFGFSIAGFGFSVAGFGKTVAGFGNSIAGFGGSGRGGGRGRGRWGKAWQGLCGTEKLSEKQIEKLCKNYFVFQSPCTTFATAIL